MKQDEIRRKLKKYAKAHKHPYDWNAEKGKGSHGTVYVNGKKSVIQRGDLPRSYVETILKQLGLPKDAI